jgi:6-pyruvoyltetrahydropterin/6-carboxytetrahydropterin synthase
MYTLLKKCEISGAHNLVLNYDSPCERPHGHNWIITVEIKGDTLNSNGMLIDFQCIKSVVHRLDHQDINKLLEGTNPTAENISRWIAQKIQREIFEEWELEDSVMTCPKVTSVVVQESEGNTICYIP